MGACLCSAAPAVGNKKSNQSDRGRPTANVISANGDLHRYALPVTVSQVLLMEFPTTPSSSSSPSTLNFFVCNSDRLYYDDYIPALDAEDELQADQIYFVLPASRLQYQLSASDMAALAVRASLALRKTSSNFNDNNNKGSSSSSSFLRPHRHRRQNKVTRISPVLIEVNNTSNNNQRVDGHGDGDGLIMTVKKGFSDKPASQGVSRSSSARSLQRYSSRRVKMAVRSFRIRLTTIYEGSVLQFY